MIRHSASTPSRQKRRLPRRAAGLLLAWTACICLCAGHARAGEKGPQRIVLDEGGKKIIYYSHNEKRYRYVEAEGLSRVESGLRICVREKLKSLQDGLIALYEPAFAGVEVRLDPGILLEARPGSNVWLGGVFRKDGAGPRLLVDAAAVLAGDLTLFRERLARLNEEKDVAPEAYYRLAWWLREAERLAEGLTPQEFKRYRAGMTEAYEKGLALERQGLDDPPAPALRTRLQRYRAFVDRYAGATPQGDAAWHLDQYRQFLHAHAAAEQALLKDKALEADERRRLLTGVCLLVARLVQRYLPDETETYKTLLLQASRHAPGYPPLAEPLRALGYERFENKWMTEKEKRALLARRAREAKAAAERKRLAEEARKLAAARAALQGGNNMEMRRTVVDPLFAPPSRETLAQLAQELPRMPEDVQRHALWRTAAITDGHAVRPVLQAGLASQRDRVRMDALDLLAARGQAPDLDMLAKFLTTEKNANLLRHAVFACEHMPGADGIDALLRVGGASGVPAPVRRFAMQRLAKTVGDAAPKNLGLDPFSWKQWWNEHRATFKRDGSH